LTQEDSHLERPRRMTGANHCPVDALRSPAQKERRSVDPSPRHAAKNHFITLYDRPSNARPRHAAPGPEPEW
jgi:hypothetical protein